MINLKKISISFKSFILKRISGFLKKNGYSVLPTRNIESLKKNYLSISKELEQKNEGIVSIVFSKDRTMQLHCFLTSYFDKIKNPSPMYVLYKASSDRHEKAYKELAEIFMSKSVFLIEEKNFRDQFLRILEESDAARAITYVDDMVFTHDFDYHSLNKVDTFENILSFSRGEDLTYSTVLKRALELPKFSDHGDLLSFSWSEIKEFSDWTYPLGVSGYMFGRIELLAMLSNIAFKAPNSLEKGMQAYMPLFEDRKGLCTKNAITVCVHDNLTQTENMNHTLGNFSLDDLLEYWEENKCIDVECFYDKPATEAQELVYKFISR